MKRALFFLCLLGSSSLLAELRVEDAYVRGLPPGVDNTSAYLRLLNTGSQDADLVGVESSLSGSAMLHEQMNHNGMLHMMPASKLTVPAGGELLLESGGAHIMLMELRQSPRPGDEVELTLLFADGQRLQVLAPVRSVLDE